MKTMKNVLVVLAMLFVFSACNTKVKKENEALKVSLDSLQMKNDSLLSLSKERKISIENYEQTLAEIEKNLADINADQSMVANLEDDLSQSNKKEIAETINERIANMRQLMENSRSKIMSLDKALNQLRKQSGAKGEQILALEQKLEMASQNLIDKESELTELTTTLKTQLEDLGQQLEEQTSVAEELRTNLNRAFYFIGKSDELKEKEIVSKEGGFIGLGKVKVINANASDKLFTKAEKDKLSTLELNSKEAILITNHPQGSYEFVKEGDMVRKFNITNAAEFWKDSNYVVIEISK
jgi:DNA repair exonuclease SbcCD ATPase subunit